MKHDHPSRRSFLRGMLTVAGSSALPFGVNLAAMGTAAAEGASDYKALVCLYMNGGNDGFNTVLPIDSTSWAEYQRIRGGSDGSIALPAPGASGGVLPITPVHNQGRSFALHPNLKAVKGLFDAGRVGIVANVGALVQPTTLAQYKAGATPLPSKLFSHNDQQATWQSSGTESSAAVGWGGRIGDMMASFNSSATFTCISASGNALYLSGQQVRMFQISEMGSVPVSKINDMLFGVPAASNPLRNIITAQGGDPFQKDYAAVTARAINSQATLSTAMLPAGSSGVPDPTPYINPNTGLPEVNPLAVQLQTVARIIGGRNTLGVRRQVFYVSMGGFDTHDFQIVSQAKLLARLAHAMAYFDTVMTSLRGVDLRQQVTLFTASDFGRTFVSNGDGTDHGWGSHHFVMGGAVKGGDIYGVMPVTGLHHNLDVGSGALLPTSSVDQYGATMAAWFGVSGSQLHEVFPNLANFTVRNLGFMK